jgi:hypothetical protein
MMVPFRFFLLALSLSLAYGLRTKFQFLRMQTDSPNKGFGSKTPAPNVIKPTPGTSKDLEKFLMMYTCKLCDGRNAQMVSDLISIT